MDTVTQENVFEKKTDDTQDPFPDVDRRLQWSFFI